MVVTEDIAYENFRRSIGLGLEFNYLIVAKLQEINFYKLKEENGLPQLIEFYKKNSEILERLAIQSIGYIIGSKPWEHEGEPYEFVNEFARKLKETDLFKTTQDNPNLKKGAETIDNFLEEHMPRLVVFQTVVYNAFINTLIEMYKQ